MGAYDTVKKLEKMRKQIIVLYVINMIFFTASVVVMAVSAMKQNEIFGSFILTCILISIGGIFGGAQNDTRKKLKKLYKETFVYDLLDDMLDDVEYYPWKGLDPDNVKKSGIIQVGNVYGSDDVLIASYKGVRFCQADVATRFVDEKNQKSPKDYFSGRLIIFDCTYKKVDDVKVLDKTFDSEIRDLNNRVSLENIEFNNKFDVYSMREEDAFYVLTPHFMEKMLELQGRYSNIGFRFTNNKLYVAVSNDYAFDARWNKKISYPIERERVRRHIQIMIDIIDVMEQE